MEHFIGCDVHTRYQVVAWVEKGTGEIRVRRLEHQTDEVKSFYSGVAEGNRRGDRSDVSGTVV